MAGELQTRRLCAVLHRPDRRLGPGEPASRAEALVKAPPELSDRLDWPDATAAVAGICAVQQEYVEPPRYQAYKIEQKLGLS